MSRRNHALLRRRASGFCALLFLVGFAGAAGARHVGSIPLVPPGSKDMHGEFALDGEFVHNVGELQLNITNWGLIGSWPGASVNMSEAPSAMWPAGSGIDYLWAAGLWIGAIKGGLPLVSTGQQSWEIMSNPDDPLETIYESHHGAEGGKRYPNPNEDDDGDGRVGEDPLNGVDDDGDGLIDEDFSAIGNQYFRCVMRDNVSLAQEIFPNHQPLGIQIVQESFQWESDGTDDFVGFRFQIENIGRLPLEQLYVGFYADCDIGPRDGSGVGADDLPYFLRAAVRAPDKSLVPVSVGVMYDADGDAGLSTGFFGMLFLDHPIDPSGEDAPERVGISTFQTFSTNRTFDEGGLPKNDEERYQLLSSQDFDDTPSLYATSKANDYRIVIASGPYTVLGTEESIEFQAAFVVGEGLGGLLRNASEAALTFYGTWFDRDNDRSTGINGRESYVCLEDFGPTNATNPLYKMFQDCVDSADFASINPPRPINRKDLDNNACIWIDDDCDFEESRGNYLCNSEVEDYLTEEDLVGCTGVGGKEFNVPWLVGLPPPPPNMRIWEANRRVHVFWNSLSQLVPDERLQQIDFESYRLWRATGWDRPFGTSIENGPGSGLWRLVAEFDEVNTFLDTREIRRYEQTQELPLGRNTGFGMIAYEPRVLRDDHPRADRIAEGRDLIRRILADPEFQFLGPTDDPAEFIRFFGPRGGVSRVGAKFPELSSWEGDYSSLDSIYWDETGVRFYEYVDREVHNGMHYFYAVTAADHELAELQSGESVPVGMGLAGDPQGNFEFAMPTTGAQTAAERDHYGHDIYVVPNPATRESLAEFSQLHPNAGDPTGVRVMFANLPQAHNTIKIFTLAGDLVQTLRHDGTSGRGSAYWNLVSRNGQRVVSGIYLYSVQTDDAAFDRVIGRFVIID